MLPTWLDPNRIGVGPTLIMSPFPHPAIVPAPVSANPNKIGSGGNTYDFNLSGWRRLGDHGAGRIISFDDAAATECRAGDGQRSKYRHVCIHKIVTLLYLPAIHCSHHQNSTGFKLPRYNLLGPTG